MTAWSPNSSYNDLRAYPREYIAAGGAFVGRVTALPRPPSP